MTTESDIREIRAELACLRGITTTSFLNLTVKVGELADAINRQSEAYDDYRKALVDLTTRSLDIAAQRDQPKPSDN